MRVSQSAATCDPTMTARARSAGLVELRVEACTAAAEFTIHHEGMMFSTVADSVGTATLVAPARSDEAVFIAAFPDGVGAIASVPVSALDGLDRIVVQWGGLLGFEVHAMEFGAEYGQPGHVSPEQPKDAARATRGEGGFLMSLGDARVARPRFAQVYTFPAARARQQGEIILSLETEVTAANCATSMPAQTLHHVADMEGLKILDVTLEVPGCEAIRDFMVLRELVPDLSLRKG